MAMSVASALVSSRLDYANSVLFGCPQKHAARLQRVQQALARVVTQQSSVSPLTYTEYDTIHDTIEEINVDSKAEYTA